MASVGSEESPERDRDAAPMDRKLLGVGGAIVAGAFMSALDATAVSVALPDIGRDLGGGVTALQWISVSYLLTLATVVPVTTWTVERWGARRMWLAALLVFGGASLLCGLAWSVESLIAFRVLQGLGGGLIPPVAQMVLVQAAGQARIGRVMSLVSVPTQLAPVLGPTAGGLLVDAFGWRWIFLANLPLCLVAVALAARMLPADAPVRRPPRPDLWGLLLLASSMTLVGYGLSAAQGPAVQAVLAIAVGAVLLATVLIRARFARTPPIVDFALFRSPTFALCSGVIFLGGASLFGMMFLLPLFHQQVGGKDALQAGLLLAPQGAGLVVSLVVTGILVDRLGPKWIVTTGIVLVVCGTLPFTQGTLTDNDLVTTVALLVRGAGLGAATLPLTATAYRSLPVDRTVHAATILVIMQRLGGSVGTAVLTLILARTLAAADGDGIEAMAGAFAHTFWWTAGLAALTVVPALFLPSAPPRAPKAVGGG
ncbi:MDR family MFS transporter [Micromonosporaceae bacterium B7E4]